jgi:cytochrome P450
VLTKFKTEVEMARWAMTHSSDNFHDPYQFLPERWLDNPYGDNLQASRPFSLGPRLCVGR